LLSLTPAWNIGFGHSDRKEKHSMMSHYGWMAGGTWVWAPLIMVLVALLLVVALNRRSNP